MASKEVMFEIEESRRRLQDSIVTRYFVAVLGAWCAEFATYPFDLAKTRLQIQNEVALQKDGLKMENRGLVGTAVHIFQKEGPLKLWAGLLPMCQRHVIYAGSRLVFYEQARKMFKDEKGRMSLPTTVFCEIFKIFVRRDELCKYFPPSYRLFQKSRTSLSGGAGCGALAQLIASPADLVKVQMQAEGRRILQGKPARFTSCTEVYKLVYRESGLLGFWRGAGPNMIRAAMVNIGDLAAYDYCKRFLYIHFEIPEGTILHTMSAFIAGFVAAVMGTPADVIKTRVMNQPVGPDGKGALYKNMLDCLAQSVRNEGFVALYKGFVPMWFRLGPWALVNWVAFEKILVLIGGKAF